MLGHEGEDAGLEGSLCSAKAGLEVLLRLAGGEDADLEGSLFSADAGLEAPLCLPLSVLSPPVSPPRLGRVVMLVNSITHVPFAVATPGARLSPWESPSTAVAPPPNAAWPAAAASPQVQHLAHEAARPAMRHASRKLW